MEKQRQDTSGINNPFYGKHHTPENKAIMREHKLLSGEFIRNQFELRNCLLLSDTYKGVNQTLQYICNKHPETIRQMTYRNFARKQNICEDCKQEKQRQGYESKLNTAKVLYEEHGYILESKKYLGKMKAMECHCINHPDTVIRLSVKDVEGGKRCPICELEIANEEKNMIQTKCIELLESNDFASSVKYSDGISFPNKLMRSILDYLKIDYEAEKLFKWCKFEFRGRSKRGFYDFYFEIDSQKIIVEMDGCFHQEPHKKSDLTLEEVKFIDSEKDRLAEENGYKMIRIDCLKSYISYIRENILNSELKEILDFDSIDWELCHKNALKSKVEQVYLLANSGAFTNKEIAAMTKLDRKTIDNYLLQGSESGLCPRRLHEYKRVACLTTKEIFYSGATACSYYKTANVHLCCKGGRNFAGTHPITKESLVWEYYDEKKHKDFTVVHHTGKVYDGWCS